MDTAAKILTGILLALLVYLFYSQYVAPYFIESSQSALLSAKQFLARDLATDCKEWTDNLALKSQFPDTLEAHAMTADVGWDWCQKKYFGDEAPDRNNQKRCRASCVELLKVQDRCSSDPASFGLDYNAQAHTITIDGIAVEVTRTSASEYCVYAQLPALTMEVSGSVCLPTGKNGDAACTALGKVCVSSTCAGGCAESPGFKSGVPYTGTPPDCGCIAECSEAAS